MRANRHLAALGLRALVLVAGLAAGHTATASDDAQAWLQRMVEATRELNYDGTFVYHNNESMQTMRIIHSVGPEGSRERLVALSGEPREVLRDRAKVTCIMPDERSVVVGVSPTRGVAGAADFDPTRDLAPHYELQTHAGGRVAGHETQVIELRPRDEYRYGYSLSVDADTGLLLKSALRAPDGSLLEQIEFTSLSIPDSIPEQLLEPSISSEGFTFYANNPQAASAGSGADPSKWEATWLPAGFRIADRHAVPKSASKAAVEQFVYSDGLASISVFIERLDDTDSKLVGYSRMGAVSAFGRMIDDYQVTAVGEVPEETVSKVAESVSRR